MLEGSAIILADMYKAVDCFDQECTAIVGDLIDEILAQSAPTCIYHYTDEAGLVGILKSRKIWLTDIFSLNDTSELRYGIGHVCDMLDENALHAHPAFGIFSRKFRILKIRADQTARYFVACFTRNGDDWGQWNIYGKNGKGFALGFNYVYLENAFKKSTSNFPNFTFFVKYDTTFIKRIYQQLIDKTTPLIQIFISAKLSNDETHKLMEKLSINLGKHTIEAAIFLKNHSFKNEDEYRFLQMRGMKQPNDDLKRVVGGNSSVQFTEFDWQVSDQDVLRKIVIGPAANEENTLAFIKDCLHDNGFDPTKINIYKSKIPLRSE